MAHAHVMEDEGETSIPIVYPRDAVLTVEQVAAGLQVSVRSVERADFPVHYIGRLARFIWGEVLDALAGRTL